MRFSKLELSTLMLLCVVMSSMGCGRPPENGVTNSPENESTNSPANSASLLSLTFPIGSEVYLSANSVYAEVDGVDVTLVVWEKAMADRAISEFRDSFQTGRSDAPVTDFQQREVLGEMAVVVNYNKPAQKVSAARDGFNVVPVREYTRQFYFDFGSESLVLTVWTKGDNAQVDAVCETLLSNATSGQAERIADVPLVLRSDGQPLETYSEVPSDNVLAKPLRVELEHQ